MTYLEIGIVCYRFFVFLKYSSHPIIAGFFLVLFCFVLFCLFFDSPGIILGSVTADTFDFIPFKAI